MLKTPSTMEKLLHSRAAAAVLETVLFGQKLHLRGIARKAGVSPSEAKRELDLLENLGIAGSETIGRQKFFFKNQECPILPELEAIYRKSDHAIIALKRAVSGLGGVKYALIYGSMAKGGARAASDIDLLAIGQVDYEKLDSAVFGIQKNSGREINYILWKEKEFLERAEEGGSFLSGIMKGSRIWLAGDEDGFVRAVKQGMGKKVQAGR